MWIIIAVSAVIFCFLILSYICVFIALYRVSEEKDSATSFPHNPQYEPYRQEMKRRIEYNRSLPHKIYSIKSRDNKKLFARFYEAEVQTAPLVIFFHGYRSSPFRDSCGAFDFFS